MAGKSLTKEFNYFDIDIFGMVAERVTKKVKVA